MKLYGHPISGNAHRAKTILGVLGLSFEDIVVDLPNGAHKQPEFLALNPLGQVPVLVDGDVVLRDSTAILVYVARKYDDANQWLPADAAGQAEVHQWLSNAVNEIQHAPAFARAMKLFGSQGDAAAVSAKIDVLFGDLFEPRLAAAKWLVGDSPTLADLACYTYIARVNEGGYDLTPYPAIRDWLTRIEQLDGFPPMGKIEDMMPAG